MPDAGARMLESLRGYVVAYQASVHALARWMDLPVTDGNAFGEVLWAETAGAPLSPARLSERIALTSGATNALVNRLERRGLVARSRESDDRRVVTLRTTPAARERAEAFTSPALTSLRETLAAHDDATLSATADLLDAFAALLPLGR
jgi:DNA-binding MarR family transcriptional regulator